MLRAESSRSRYRFDAVSGSSSSATLTRRVVEFGSRGERLDAASPSASERECSIGGECAASSLLPDRHAAQNPLPSSRV
jgi:hypothetical protein